MCTRQATSRRPRRSDRSLLGRAHFPRRQKTKSSNRTLCVSVRSKPRLTAVCCHTLYLGNLFPRGLRQQHADEQRNAGRHQRRGRAEQIHGTFVGTFVPKQIPKPDTKAAVCTYASHILCPCPVILRETEISHPGNRNFSHGKHKTEMARSTMPQSLYSCHDTLSSCTMSQRTCYVYIVLWIQSTLYMLSSCTMSQRACAMTRLVLFE